MTDMSLRLGPDDPARTYDWYSGAVMTHNPLGQLL